LLQSAGPFSLSYIGGVDRYIGGVDRVGVSEIYFFSIGPFRRDVFYSKTHHA